MTTLILLLLLTLMPFLQCAAITLDYKLNFTPEKSSQIPELHERVAERLYDLFTTNGGLYIKIGMFSVFSIQPVLTSNIPPTRTGQAIGANAGLLPKAMQVKFARLFDDAPQVPYSDVVAVFQKEFGKRPEEMFDEFEEQAVASASIAQVHRAKIKGTGERVAIKVQKPAVTKQVEWDLGIYR
jgi:aarF domain-containing kinase